MMKKIVEMLKKMIAKVKGCMRWVVGQKDNMKEISAASKTKSVKEAYEALSFAGFLLYLIMQTIIGYIIVWLVFVWLYMIAIIMVFMLGQTVVNLIFIPLLYICIGLMYVCKIIFWALVVVLIITMVYWLLLRIMPGVMNPIHNKVKNWWINRKSKAKTTANGVVEPEVVK